MPRIAAASIEEHVRMQRARVTQAARKLFARQGYRRTDMGDIAAAIGLARNSLYRYYPNKDFILLACIREDMEPQLERLAALHEEFPEPLERIYAWLDMQFDMATGPAHATMEMMAEVREASAELNREVRYLHESPTAVLEQAVAELPARGRDIKLLTRMIGSMVLAATSYALSKNSSAHDAVRAELVAAVGQLIEGESYEY